MSILFKKIYNKYFIILLFFIDIVYAEGFNYLPLSQYQWEYIIQEGDHSFLQHVRYEKLDTCNFALHTQSIRKTSYFYKVRNDSIFLCKIYYSPSFLPIRLKISPTPPILNFYSNMKEGDTWQWQGSFKSLIKSIPAKQKFEITEQSFAINQFGTVNRQIMLCILSEIKGEQDTTFANYCEGIGLVEQNGTNQSKHLSAAQENTFYINAQYSENNENNSNEMLWWQKIFGNTMQSVSRCTNASQ